VVGWAECRLSRAVSLAGGVAVYHAMAAAWLLADSSIESVTRGWQVLLLSTSRSAASAGVHACLTAMLYCTAADP
jgi:hypothetical protein